MPDGDKTTRRKAAFFIFDKVYWRIYIGEKSARRDLFRGGCYIGGGIYFSDIFERKSAFDN